jgi:hypothetical protein
MQLFILFNIAIFADDTLDKWHTFDGVDRVMFDEDGGEDGLE